MNELPLEVAYVRSPYDLAEITSVEVNEALKLPGVVSVIKAKDIPAGPLPTMITGKLICAISSILSKIINHLHLKTKYLFYVLLF